MNPLFCYPFPLLVVTLGSLGERVAQPVNLHSSIARGVGRGNPLLGQAGCEVGPSRVDTEGLWAERRHRR